MSIPSFCIPYVPAFINDEVVEATFNKIFDKVVCVDHIDKLSKKDVKNGRDYNVFFIHFKDDVVLTGYAKEQLDHMVETIKENNYVKLHYDPPKKWFWKVFINKAVKKEDIVPFVSAPEKKEEVKEEEVKEEVKEEDEEDDEEDDEQDHEEDDENN